MGGDGQGEEKEKHGDYGLGPGGNRTEVAGRRHDREAEAKGARLGGRVDARVKVLEPEHANGRDQGKERAG